MTSLQLKTGSDDLFEKLERVNTLSQNDIDLYQPPRMIITQLIESIKAYSKYFLPSSKTNA